MKMSGLIPIPESSGAGGSLQISSSGGTAISGEIDTFGHTSGINLFSMDPAPLYSPNPAPLSVNVSRREAG
jgi:hypothetical protein